MSEFKLQAQKRVDTGKGASRRLRRLNGLLPGILYGDEKAPEMLTLIHKDLAKLLESEAFYSSIITLNVDNKPVKVLLKDLQRHPAKPTIQHVDFLRVSSTRKIHVRVPLHFIHADNCIGVKQQGGVISHNINQLEVSCLASDLPEYIEIDLSTLELGHILHISDLKLPANVESVELSHGEAHDLPVVSVNAPKVEKAEVEAVAVAAPAAAAKPE